MVFKNFARSSPTETPFLLPTRLPTLYSTCTHSVPLIFCEWLVRKITATLWVVIFNVAFTFLELGVSILSSSLQTTVRVFHYAYFQDHRNSCSGLSYRTSNFRTCGCVSSLNNLKFEVCAAKKLRRHRQFFFVFGRRRVNLPAPPPPIFTSVARGKGHKKEKTPFSSLFPLFSGISERNKDYSDTLDFIRG